MKNLYKNIHEALNLYLDGPKDSISSIPVPVKNIKLSKNIVEVPVDPKIANALLLNHKSQNP